MGKLTFELLQLLEDVRFGSLTATLDEWQISVQVVEELRLWTLF
jgi:hypothetical protein